MPYVSRLAVALLVVTAVGGAAWWWRAGPVPEIAPVEPAGPAAISAAPSSAAEPAAPEAPIRAAHPAAAPDDLRFTLTRSGDIIALAEPAGSEVAGSIAAAARRVAPSLTLAESLQTNASAGGPPLPAADFVVEQIARLKSGSVTVRHGKIDVAGVALDRDAATAIGLSLQQPPAGLKAAAPSLSAAPVTPYRFAVRREPGRVVLSGHVPDSATRAELTATLRKRLFDERLVDDLRLADGAPPQFRTVARDALERVGEMASGEIAITDTRMTVAGAMLYGQAAAALRDSWVQSLPEGWRAKVEIRAAPPSE